MDKIKAVNFVRSFFEVLKSEKSVTLKKDYDVSLEQLQEIKETVSECGMSLSDLRIVSDEEVLLQTTYGRDVFDIFQYDGSQQEVFGIETILYSESGETDLTLLGDITVVGDDRFIFVYKLIEVK